ncbi:MAG: acyl-CoA dehydrogenase [Streptosporangiales bacterium]|nr:acyl-CoA dehydrogenase [Streptosporangiales bacterium]
MDFTLTEEQRALARSVADLCAHFPEEYWNKADQERTYPAEFVDALTEAGYLAVLIPEEYGGGGGTLTDAAVILEAVNRSGGSGLPAHAQMYTMGTILRHGNEEQKARWLPEIAAGRLRLQSFAVTEPDAGSDTSSITTSAVRDGDEYVINGAKMWTSRVEHTDLMLILTRTTPRADVTKKTDGISTFVVDLREAGDAVEIRPIRTMVPHETYSLFINDLRVPAANLVGEEGRGFRYILSGMNAERVLVASEVLGDGYWLVAKAAEYASQRVVFDRPIGANQAVQFPIAQAYAQLEAASLMRFKAAAVFERGEQPGMEANAAKLLASQATWEAANAAMTAFGGYGVADEYGIHRKFREARFQLIAPVSNNLVLSYIGTHVLGMPRSY